MTEKKEIPSDVLADLIWLEAKQVLRGFPSELFPDLTWLKARIIRGMGYEAFKAQFIKEIPNGS